MHVQAQTFKDVETRLDPGAGAGVFDVALCPHIQQ